MPITPRKPVSRASRRVDKAAYYNPDPAYLGRLVRDTGLSTKAVAARIGIGDRTLRAHLAHPDSSSYRKAPYTVQVALEALALAL